MIPIDEILRLLRAKLGIAIASVAGAVIFGVGGCASGIVFADGFLGGLEHASISIRGGPATAVVVSCAISGTLGGIFTGILKGSGMAIPALASGLAKGAVEGLAWIFTYAFIGIWDGGIVAIFYVTNALSGPPLVIAERILSIISAGVIVTILIALTALTVRDTVSGMIQTGLAVADEARVEHKSAEAQFAIQLMWLYTGFIFTTIGAIDGLTIYLYLKLIRPPAPFSFEALASRPMIVIWFASFMGLCLGGVIAGAASLRIQNE